MLAEEGGPWDLGRGAFWGAGPSLEEASSLQAGGHVHSHLSRHVHTHKQDLSQLSGITVYKPTSEQLSNFCINTNTKNNTNVYKLYDHGILVPIGQ